MIGIASFAAAAVFVALDFPASLNFGIGVIFGVACAWDIWRLQPVRLGGRQ